MRKLDLDKLAQPYVGRTEDYTKALFPRATTAELADPAALVNVVGKYAGRMVYDLTNGYPVWASGPLPADAWIDQAAAKDPSFASVAYLTNFDTGVDGGQSYTSEDSNASTLTFNEDGTGTCALSNAVGNPFGAGIALKCTAGADSSGNIGYTSVPFETNHSIGTGDFTIEMWWYVPSFSSKAQMILGGQFNASAGPNRSWSIQSFDLVNGTHATLNSLGLGYSSDGANTLILELGRIDTTVAQWQHIAMVRDSGTIHTFADGVRVGAGVASPTIHSCTAVEEIQAGAAGGRVLSNATTYIGPYRYTPGVVRYSGTTYDVPTAAFPTS